MNKPICILKFNFINTINQWIFIGDEIFFLQLVGSTYIGDWLIQLLLSYY